MALNLKEKPALSRLSTRTLFLLAGELRLKHATDPFIISTRPNTSISFDDNWKPV
jgi:hypothetical protein